MAKTVRKPAKASKARKASATNKVPSAGPPALKQGTTKLTLGKMSATVTKGPKSTTLKLVRVIKAPPERVYAAFLDPDAMAKWLPPHGFTGRVHSIDARVGGSYKMSFNTINRSWGHSFGGTYKELVPGRRIVHTDKFDSDDPVMGGAEMLVTIDFKRVKEGTQITVLQEGIPAGPAADGSPYGWSQSLDNLANLCEAELPF